LNYVKLFYTVKIPILTASLSLPVPSPSQSPHRLTTVPTPSSVTNVPIDETIEIIKNTFFKAKPKRSKTRKNAAIDKLDEYEGDLEGNFWKITQMLFTRVIFCLYENMCRQIDGVSMGSHLGPIIANIFMWHLRINTWINFLS
jgi:hypothetical protein